MLWKTRANILAKQHPHPCKKKTLRKERILMSFIFILFKDVTMYV